MRMHMSMYMHMCMCMHMYMYMHMHVHMHMYDKWDATSARAEHTERDCVYLWCVPWPYAAARQLAAGELRRSIGAVSQTDT